MDKYISSSKISKRIAMLFIDTAANKYTDVSESRFEKHKWQQASFFSFFLEQATWDLTTYFKDIYPYSSILLSHFDEEILSITGAIIFFTWM